MLFSTLFPTFRQRLGTTFFQVPQRLESSVLNRSHVPNGLEMYAGEWRGRSVTMRTSILYI